MQIHTDIWQNDDEWSEYTKDDIFMISIIIPCYKSSHTIRSVVELTMEELNKLNRDEYEFVLVDDASPDGGATTAELLSLVRDYECVRFVELAKNAGQHNAVMAGLNNARGDIFIAMDDDMQTHPSQLKYLLEEFDKGYDIVYAYYPEKKHSGFRNFGSFVNHMTIRFLLKKPKDMKTSSFWVIRKFVRDYVIEYKSAYTHLQGLFLRTTRNISSVPIRHFDRAYGTSNYTLKKLIQLWSNILGFSIVPLKFAMSLGYLFSLTGLVGAVVVVIQKIVRPYMQLGWPSMMAAICFFSGINLLFMGLIGEYVGRIFQGMSNNPQFVVRAVHEHKAEDRNTEKNETSDFPPLEEEKPVCGTAEQKDDG